MIFGPYDSDEKATRRWRVVRRIIGFLIILAIPVWVCRIYWSEIQAVLWHASHGKTTSFGGHTVSVPGKWWKVTSDDLAAGVISRVRSRHQRLIPSLVAYPLREVSDSDADLRERQRRIADLGNAGRYHVGTDAEDPEETAAANYSSIVVQTVRFPLYCLRTQTMHSNGQSVVELTCESAREPWMYSYYGPAQSEIEAVGILQSLR